MLIKREFIEIKTLEDADKQPQIVGNFRGSADGAFEQARTRMHGGYGTGAAITSRCLSAALTGGDKGICVRTLGTSQRVFVD